MVDLLDQVLKYQLLSTFLLRLEKTWVPVGPFIKEYVERLKLVSAEKHVSLNLHLHPNDDPSAPSFDTEKVLLDRTKFGIIIINIVSNAVKFSPAHKSIDINAYFIKTDIKHEKKRSLLRCCKRKVRPSSARVREWTLVIEFIDQGVGLKAESLKKLFVEVIQFDANLNQGGGGSGMGMFIAKGIADLHGGTLTAHSDGLDMGSTFTVTLPLDQYEEEDDDDFTVSQLESSSSVEKESGSNYDRDTGRDIGMQVEVDIESRPSSVPIPSLGGPAPSFPFHKARKEAEVAANAEQERTLRGIEGIVGGIVGDIGGIGGIGSIGGIG
jgi:light-regulated signal transduction histidine kinase (bacteriophytochrome)